MGYPSPALSVDAWASEEKKYNYEKGHFSETTGHFTQLVWQNTTHVGCGAAKCNNDAANGAKGWFLVCEYTPAGNVDGGYGYNVGKAGISDDGKPGFGAASRMNGSLRLLMALVAVSSLAAVCV